MYIYIYDYICILCLSSEGQLDMDEDMNALSGHGLLCKVAKTPMRFGALAANWPKDALQIIC